MSTLTVKSIHYYPVKSLQGIPIDVAGVGLRGIRFDREWMVVDSDGKFLTQRTNPKMACVQTAITGSDLVLAKRGLGDISIPLEWREGVRRDVVVWDDRLSAVDQGGAVSAWLSAALEVSCRLVRFSDDHIRNSRKGEGHLSFADGYPFLIVSQASLDDLNRRICENGGEAVAMEQFRPNIVVDGCEPYEEDRWKGVLIGDISMVCQTTCVRCAITMTDQTTGERSASKEPLRTLATYRNSRERGGVIFGRNCNHFTRSLLQVGDKVTPWFF